MAQHIQTQINMKDVEVGQMIVSNPPDNQKAAGATETNIESDGPPHTQSGFIYKLSGDAPRILIISNSKWAKDPLPGYKCDAKNLKAMWEGFGCTVDLQKNLNGEEMRRYVSEFSKDLLKGTENYCAIFILSHGNHLEGHGEIIYGVDGNFVAIDEILQMFNNVENAKLHNIPKFFVFQCCRGGSMTQAVPVTKASTAAGGEMTSEKIPHVSDTIAMYATQPKNVAIVDNDGSWLIKDMVKVFPEYASSEHLADMLTIVNRKVSERIVESAEKRNLVGVKCMSEIRSTLVSKLYLK